MVPEGPVLGAKKISALRCFQRNGSAFRAQKLVSCTEVEHSGLLLRKQSRVVPSKQGASGKGRKSRLPFIFCQIVIRLSPAVVVIPGSEGALRVLRVPLVCR